MYDSWYDSSNVAITSIMVLSLNVLKKFSCSKYSIFSTIPVKENKYPSLPIELFTGDGENEMLQT